MAMQFDKCGGFRWLDSFVMSGIVQLATIRFCEKFLDRRNDPCGRLYDQMTQAARSGKANIIEGSERAATSKETEMKLTDVAKASLGELRGDFENWLLRHGKLPWRRDSAEAEALSGLRLDKPEYSGDVIHDSCAHILRQQQKFARWLEAEDAEVVANALLILISRTIVMLNHQLQAQGDRFAESGGFREQLAGVRTTERAKQDGAPVCPECGKAMRRRTAQSGKNAGRAFWGCTGYPECRAVRPAE